MAEHQAAGRKARAAAALTAEKVAPKIASASKVGAAEKLAALKEEKERAEERIQALMVEHQEAGRLARVAAAIAVAKKGQLQTTPSEEEKPIEEDGVVITM